MTTTLTENPATFSAQLAARKRERELAYRQLARQISEGGKLPAIDRVESVLAGANKTPEDLDAQVALWKKRTQLHGQSNQTGGYHEALAALDTTAAKARETYLRALGEWNLAIAAHTEGTQAAQQGIAMMTGISRELADANAGLFPDLLKQRNEASAQLDAVKNEIQQRTILINKHTYDLDMEVRLQRGAELSEDAFREDRKKQVAYARKRIMELEPQVPALQAAFDALEKRLASENPLAV